MKRAGFTMIELIFVIVILGILAAVAIPKLAATRTDASATAALADYKTALNDIKAYTMAQGAIPTDLNDATTNSQGIVAATDGANDYLVHIKVGTNICAILTRTNDSNITVSAGGQIAEPECALVQSNYETGMVVMRGTSVSR